MKGSKFRTMPKKRNKPENPNPGPDQADPKTRVQQIEAALAQATAELDEAEQRCRQIFYDLGHADHAYIQTLNPPYYGISPQPGYDIESFKRFHGDGSQPMDSRTLRAFMHDRQHPHGPKTMPGARIFDHRGVGVSGNFRPVEAFRGPLGGPGGTRSGGRQASMGPVHAGPQGGLHRGGAGAGATGIRSGRGQAPLRPEDFAMTMSRL